ncbi:MAG: hypothetical protein JNJ83_21545 [Verrucomicrobiaceae bacterium]|nr:hypothetical protein [Verrucomicrobiaceae bacterium]
MSALRPALSFAILALALTSCDTLRTARGSGRVSTRNADPEDRITLEEHLLLNNTQSRVLRLAAADAGQAGYTLRFRYQTNGSGTVSHSDFIPGVNDREFPIVIDHSPRQPMTIGIVQRQTTQGSTPRFSFREYDPAPNRYPAYAWNPNLPALRAGTQVVAVWPAPNVSPSFDPLDNTYRSRLIVEISPR